MLVVPEHSSYPNCGKKKCIHGYDNRHIYLPCQFRGKKGNGNGENNGGKKGSWKEKKKVHNDGTYGPKGDGENMKKPIAYEAVDATYGVYFSKLHGNQPVKNYVETVFKQIHTITPLYISIIAKETKLWYRKSH